tara:strand:+ start:443 stop:874 length:432 start_codon:yes stop_codon:yes gene_type:complete
MSKIADIGLGFILDMVRFNVGISMTDWGHGFQSRCAIRFRKHTPQQNMAMQLWAEENDLCMTKNLSTKENIAKWLDALEPYVDLLKNRVGYESMLWILENPMPKANETYDTFLKWATAWDSKNDELRDFIFKPTIRLGLEDSE